MLGKCFEFGDGGLIYGSNEGAFVTSDDEIPDDPDNGFSNCKLMHC